MTNDEVQEFVTRFAAAWASRDGDAFLAAQLPAHWHRLERLMGELSPAQRGQLVRLLDRMVSSIEQERGRIASPHLPGG